MEVVIGVALQVLSEVMRRTKTRRSLARYAGNPLVAAAICTLRGCEHLPNVETFGKNFTYETIRLHMIQ